ncbi:hypothetical protein CEUSTIGMA_g9776.t1 [Chlamydomonas eustigma]|uniref:glutamine--tRNA ligase n=1 Tax=Chlamydomonas eustigma TaxID=1157962 RepID=A0A250XGZ5_9CHLO|nr:hypothetical protein CEUSTIGMA_g9776.t1 [Chlamydomonas eustigma]|eukprot:GAX82347.1 hypothetical protein CEUSTIGMA_g9776.t1 [Chlamydomonas eustigma]
MSLRDEAEAAALALFQKIDLDDTVSKNIVKNPKLTKALVEIIHEAKAENGCSKSKGNLLNSVATKYPANALVHRPKLLEYIMTEKIKSVAQLDGAFEYLKKIGTTDLDTAVLETFAGVGIVISPEQIKSAVDASIAENKARILEERYHCNLSILLGQITRALKWADGASVRGVLEAEVEKLLGPKTEEDLKPPEKKQKPKAPPKEAKEESKAQGSAKPEEPSPPEDPYAFLPKPADNNQVHTSVNFSDGRIMRIANTPQKLGEHLAFTGGKVITRFPPEPNGYLHIGHAKAMFVDFGMAAQYDGHCYLRYDDTNPTAEKLEYIDHIQEIVAWMGWKPWKITYSSDYFDELHAMAVELIKRGHAYVCHQTKDEIEASRKALEPSPWRDRPIAESLSLFEDMRRGLVDEGAATLRMRMDHKNENFNMFDLIAFRIKFAEHPHAGDKWCIYPSYDYTHCLVDALENITHSLCTLEFESRRASYYWLLEVLDTYKPFVWEYARLNITNTVMSKRKLNKLVTGGHVNGWDDPRLLTLAGMRRRGMTPTAINNFCREIGITRNDNLIPMHKLEYHIRSDLDATSPRTLAVLRPLKVVITNLDNSHIEHFQARLFPGRSEDTYSIPLTRVVYVEETDFKEVDEKDYYGLAPGKTIMLKYAYIVKCTGFTKDPTGKVVELQVEADLAPAGKKPPKGVLNWVAQPTPGQEPPTAEARIYDYLFKSEDPGTMDEWLEDLDKESLQVIKGVYVTPALARAKVGDRFQFERLGYFAVDPDSVDGKLVFNRTVTLKESAARVAAASASVVK